MGKIELPVGKQDWHPSVLPGQIVLVTTISPDGYPNLAPKSWVSMAAFSGPIVGFGCTMAHRTARNVVAQGEFVINAVPEGLVDRIWPMIDTHGAERIARSGLTLVDAARVRPPRVGECPGHLECVLDDVKRWDGDEVFLFGRIVSVSVDASCASGELPERYARLGPVFFLEDRHYATIGTAKVAP